MSAPSGSSEPAATSKYAGGQAVTSTESTGQGGLFHGVVNHLTPEQEKKLEEFKARLQADKWWSPDGANGKPTHDDGTLLRFLRARKFEIAGAYDQFTETEKWLKETKVEELYNHFDVEFYERARVLYPQWTGHRDKRGKPVYVFFVKDLNSKTVAQYQKDAESLKASSSHHKTLSTPAKQLPLFALYQNLLNFVLPMVSTLDRPNPEIPVTNSVNIVDISGVGLSQFWSLKGHMQDASTLATAKYPETLDRIFIIGAPSFFPTVWGYVKAWFDPVTVSKIFILSKSEVLSTLSQHMHVKDIPKKYGGELDWQWGDLPHLDEETRAAVESDGQKGWFKGPSLWLNGKRLVVGTEDGKLRHGDDSIIEKSGPVVYAADGTAVPVHSDTKKDTSSAPTGQESQAEGATNVSSDSSQTQVDEQPAVEVTETMVVEGHKVGVVETIPGPPVEAKN